MISVSEWEQLGWAGHFIASDSCRMHMATRVGRYLISTVGCYAPMGAEQPQEIGYRRLYETFVFDLGENVEAARCSCGDDCGMYRPSIYAEIDSLGANSGAEAQRNHRALCEKWAR